MLNQVQDGKVLTFLESQLVHPSHTDGLVNAGDPCVVGVLVGVAYENAAAATDKIDLATEGVFNLAVLAKHAGAVNDAVAAGDQIYIDATTAVLSKDATDVAFGVALDAVAEGATGTIPVKIVQSGPVAAVTQSTGPTDGVTKHTASEAISKTTSGTHTLGSGGALAMTLASPADPGDDGKVLFIVAATAHAHTVTTAANKIVGQGATGDVLTFADAGDAVTLEAVGGLWYIRSITPTNPALSEVP